MKKWIAPEDVVDVYFANGLDEERMLIVISRPSDIGDSWIFKRQDGVLVEVLNFSKIILIQDNEGKS